ncbi:phage tail sheath subtilisin-like domain-containing protein [Rahnella contaminans]|uniref:phage tail sheath subtilisin-like domain-containing protein n=1 Tax=Rahnella contaminans TaxID=2703882 RepID=UPI003C2E9D23
MTVQLQTIQSDIRTPLCQIEINNTGAVTGTPTPLNKVLVFGQMDTTGTAVSGTLYNVYSPSMAQGLFGRSSMLAAQLAAFKDVNTNADVWAIALDDDEAGAKATGGLSITGTASANGTLSVMIGGVRIRQGVITGDDADDISASLVATINTNLDVPVIASVYVPPAPPEQPQAEPDPVTPTVVFTARHAGEFGNDIDIRVNYYTGEQLPTGIACTPVVMTGGTANPDVSPVIAGMGDEWWNYVINPYNDQANLDILAEELVKRWGPDKMIDGMAFMAYRGTLADTTTYGTGRNDFLFNCMGTGNAPTPPYLWSARMAAVCIASLVIDPARPMQTLAVAGLLAPQASDRWPREDRETLLHDGISTYTVNGDVVQVERMITMYRTDSYGNPDVSYLNVNTPMTLSYIRYATRTRIEEKFPRCKLADDGTPTSAGQAIVTPSIIRDELIALAQELAEQGLIEDVDAFSASLVVERDASDKDRVNVYSSPNIVNQFRVYAQAINFIL